MTNKENELRVRGFEYKCDLYSVPFAALPLAERRGSASPKSFDLDLRLRRRILARTPTPSG
jgi:hypothetical protein